MNGTFTEILDYRAAATPNRTALVFADRSYSYGELRERALARVESLPCKAGERFGIIDQNSIAALELVLAGAYTGAVPVIVNWRLTTPEIGQILSDADCSALYADAGTLSTEARESLVRKFNVTLLDENAALSSAASGPQFVPQNRDDFLQLYTSGTTGRPKGVRTTHQNMMDLLYQLMLEVPAFGPESQNLVTAPFFHIAGIGYMLFGLYAGARNVLLPRFEARAVIDTIERESISHALLVPAMQKAVLDEAERAGADFASLAHILYGASPIPEPLLRRAAEQFNCGFTQAYGLTETTGVATLLTTADHRAMLDSQASPEVRARISSAGKAAFGIEIRIEGGAGVALPAGEEGEVLLRGLTVMPGYWGGTTLNEDGWLRTGDVGHLDEDGYLFLLDRLDDLIVTGGEKVYPVEVERALHETPGILDAAVAGIPDEEFGEAVCAFVVTSQELDTQQLRMSLKKSLADFKVPRRFEFRSDLPRSPSGKVLRRELRAPFWQGRERRIH